MLDHSELYFCIKTLLELQERVTRIQLKELSQIHNVSKKAAFKGAKEELDLVSERNGPAGPAFVKRKVN